ncbi:DUF4968 domain-containing protein [Aestuariibacter halophilus]|uniref:DUF4968 domain-containing protein n=1 Tax=Fluctibacter halophilus TaxID=226011 RepID=A0ABS8G6M5_9ALTE|nr:TIM-barrel domain-containing protein [Aestuariibacter halophilus]MCC2615495.1 DUF4968 domain-containing protein [Aestuariibacter halophilus]
MSRFFIALGLWAIFATAPLQAAEYVSHVVTGNVVTVRTDEGLVRLRALTDDALEVWYQPDGVEQLPAFAIAEQQVANAPDIELNHTGQSLILTLPGLTAVMQKSPLRIRYLRDEKPLLGEEIGLFVNTTQRGFRFFLTPAEKLFGGGQRVLGMDRRGHRLPLYNQAHYGYGDQSAQMNYSLPAVMSDRGYALLFDNSARGVLDIGHNNPDILQFEAVAGRTAYIVIGGDGYRQLTQNIGAVTGFQPLPPRWMMGNFASRFGYRSEQQTRETVALFKQHGVPLDAVVLDLFWFGPDIQGHMGNLAWDRNAFPDPEGMMADFQQQGIKTVVITEPFVLTTSSKFKAARAANALATDLAGNTRRFDFYFGNTALIDIFNPQAKAWFSEVYTRLSDQGVAGWWGDLGEPEVHPADTLHRVNGKAVPADAVHNVYGHEWACMVYEQEQHLRPGQRPFILMRAGFLGSQRYGMIPWTGDVSRSWQGLASQVEQSLQMGLFGLAYTHSDLGGFAGGERFDQDLYLRWLLYGVFQPVYRPHAQEHIAPEPVFHDDTTLSLARRFVQLRYQLLPYNYSLAIEHSLTGLPLMRPMVMAAQGEQWFDVKDQYLWGEAFLVKPITAPAQTAATVLLPGGVWFDFWTGNRHSGDKAIVPVSLETIPVLVKAGSFVVMGPRMNTTQDYQRNQWQVHYYHDDTVTSAQSVLFDDDGHRPDTLRNGHYQKLVMTSQAVNGEQLSLTLQLEGDDPSAPAMRSVEVIVHQVKQKPAQVSLSDDDGQDQAVPFQWNAERQQLSFNAVLNKALRVTISN